MDSMGRFSIDNLQLMGDETSLPVANRIHASFLCNHLRRDETGNLVRRRSDSHYAKAISPSLGVISFPFRNLLIAQFCQNAKQGFKN
jgi:hypothetical protein